MAKARILLIDDEPEILETTRWAFEASGYEVLTAHSGEEALHLISTKQPDILLVDFKLPRMSGVEFLKEAKLLNSTLPVIMITGLTHQSEEIEKECQQSGAAAFLRKPLRMEEVLQVVARTLQQQSGSKKE